MRTRLLTLFLVFSAALVFLPGAKADFQVMVCAGGNQAKIDGFSLNRGSNAFYTDVNCSKTDAYPDGDSSFMRIKTVGSGKIKSGYPSFSWSSPKYIRFRMVNAYTREQNMTAGWRHQLVGVRSGKPKVLVSLCSGCKTGGVEASSTSIYAPRGETWNRNKALFDKFKITVKCVADQGCERSPATVTDANSLVFLMNDSELPKVSVTPSKMTSGQIVIGKQPVTFAGSDLGSGVSFGQVLVDGKPVMSTPLNSGCRLLRKDAKVYARSFTPCPGALEETTMTLDTALYSDGAHELSVCVVDYAGGRTCQKFPVQFLNTPIPRPVIVERPNNPSYDPTPVFVFEGEEVTTFYCRIDAGKWKVCPATFKTESLGLGQHTIEVFQIDQYGRKSETTSFTWRIERYQCTLSSYSARLTPQGLKVSMTGIRKRLVRLRLYPMSVRQADLDNPKLLLWGWRRTTLVGQNRRVLIRPYGFRFTKAISRYVRKHGKAKLVVTVVNEKKACNTFNIKRRTKVLRFTPKIIRGLGL